jgi:hypothetical protein
VGEAQEYYANRSYLPQRLSSSFYSDYGMSAYRLSSRESEEIEESEYDAYDLVFRSSKHQVNCHINLFHIIECH